MQEPKSDQVKSSHSIIRYSKNVQRRGDESSHALDTLAIHGVDLAEFLSMDKPHCGFPKSSVLVHLVH